MINQIQKWKAAAEAAMEHPICKLCDLPLAVPALIQMVEARDKALEVAMKQIEDINTWSKKRHEYALTLTDVLTKSLARIAKILKEGE